MPEIHAVITDTIQTYATLLSYGFLGVLMVTAFVLGVNAYRQARADQMTTLDRLRKVCGRNDDVA
jgi:hypothetical protein